MTKNILIILGVLIGLSVLTFTCNWIGNGEKVVQQEFSPEAMLKKYEWFKNQSEFIKKAQQDITNLKAESNIKLQYEEENGKEHSKWAPLIQKSYLDDIEQNKQQKLSLLSNTNKLIADYNAQSAKFNWSGFKTKDDLPPVSFESIK